MSYRKLLTTKSLNSRLRDIWEDARFGRRIAQAATGFGALAPLMALANPTGGQVVGGAATITTPNANKTQINQTSQNAAINWQQFSVGANQYVQFLQPNSSSVVLNRVIGGNPSSIFGNISANGQVFLINPNGILFGRGATLDVSGLVASTQSISDTDFMAGRYKFTKAAGAPDASVINQGIINANSGYVVLAGDYVENDGMINAQSGRVLLAAGGGTTLTLDRNNGLIGYSIDSATLARLAGVNNTGSISADGGTVIMTADVANALTATAVNNSGFVAAHSITSRGGVIVLMAKGGDIDNSGTLDASATASGVAGGTVILRGNGLTKLDPASVIETGGDGAKGGFIELSGHTLHIGGQVDPGHGGSLLIDPSKLFITAGSSAGGSITSGDFVGEHFIDTKLSAGVNVVLVASNSIAPGNPGGVASGPATTITAGGTGNLTIKTGSLNVTAGGTLAGFVPSHCGINGVCQPGGSVVFTAGSGTINLTGMSINIKGGFTANALQGNVTLSSVQAATVNIVGGNINLTGNVTASVGNLSIHAHHGPALPVTVTGAGKILTGKAVTVIASGSYGGQITLGDVMATGGSIHITADDTSLVSGSATITAGNLTGKAASFLVLGPSKVALNVGAVTAPHIGISASGKSDTVITGAITAVNSASSALVHVSETASVTGNITVNGNITVSGKPRATFANAPGVLDLPEAATVFLDASGSGNGTRTVQVNGAINVTAVAGAYTGFSHNEGGVVNNRNQSGTGGVAAAFIHATGSHGAASVTGDITIKGPDAHVFSQAHSITVHNVTVSGSGHHVSRSILARATASNSPAKNSYASSNSAGQAMVTLGDFTGSASATTLVKAGNITVSGKGIAEVGLFGTHVSAGNISVTATAASGHLKQKGNVFGALCASSCSHKNSGSFYRGISDVALHSGSINGGRAVIGIAARRNIGNGSSAAPAVTIKTGALGATGVGLADITLGGGGIQTLGLTVAATKGTEKGVGSSTSGLTAATHFAHTFNINGGEARIKVRSGGSGSHSSGLLTVGGGPVTIGGNISASGPGATVDVKGKTITVGGTVTVAGSGGALTSTTVVTPPGGGGYSTSFNGPGRPTTLNLQGAVSGSVNVAGNIDVKAPGLVGVILLAGGVNLHGLSGSASAVKTYTAKDTRVSTTANTFAIGSLAVVVDDVKGAAGAPAFTSASDTGNVSLLSKGNVDLAARIKVGGKLAVQGAGNVFGNSGSVVSRFNALQNRVRAGSHSGGGAPKPGTLPHLSVTATAVSMLAGGSIDLSSAALNIGTGLAPGVTPDSGLLAQLAALHLSPVAPGPDGYFKAGTTLTMGAITMTGDYLYMQANAISMTGALSLPAKSVVQVSPFSATLPIDIEDTTLLAARASRSVFTFSAAPTLFGLTNQAFLSLFPGDTIVIGNATEVGSVTLGANGPIKIGTTNLIIDTLGPVTGLGTVTTTGIVKSLFTVLAIPPVTSGEIDPTTSTGLGDATDKKKLGSNDTGGTGGQQGGTVSQDTTTSNVCH